MAYSWKVAVWSFREVINGSTLAAIKARVNLLPNDANRHKGPFTTYAEVVNHVLGCLATDTVITRADEEIHNFKQVSVTPWDISEKLWDLEIWFGGVWNEQTQCQICVEGISLIISSTLRSWWADTREAILKDLANQHQSLLDLRGRYRKTADKEDQWTEVMWRSTEYQKGGAEQSALWQFIMTLPRPRKIGTALCHRIRELI